MNNSGDAAEQIVKMSLEGVNAAVRITGAAAKEIAVFLIAAMKNNDKNLKLKGKERLNSMLKSGKPLEIFSVKEGDLKKFMQGAKEYGIVYCVVRNTKNNKDGLCDVMVKADDAPKISRLVERYKFATVDKAKIEKNIDMSKTENTAEPKGSEQEAPDVNPEKLLQKILGNKEGKSEPDKPETENPKPDKAEKEPTDQQSFFTSNPPTTSPSEPISGSEKTPEKNTMNKKSVKEEIREITAAKKTENIQTITHKQPRRKKPKPKKTRGQR